MRVDEAVFSVCIDHDYCVGNGGCPLDINNKSHCKMFCRDYDNPELIKILLDLGYQLDENYNISISEDTFSIIFSE